MSKRAPFPSPTGRLRFDSGPNMQQISPKTPEVAAIREAFVNPRKPQSASFQQGQWVVSRKTGELGMIETCRGIGFVVKFGSSGPTKYFSGKELRWATLQEVIDDGKQGIGYTPSPECP